MIALVTGVGAKGQVGEAVVTALAARGDRVLLIARTDAQAGERAADERARGGDAHGYACDLADPAAIADLGERVRRDHGNRLDALVNLAGGFDVTGPLSGSDPGLLHRLYRINFLTAYLTTREFLPAVKEARGAIVYFASEKVLEGVGSASVAGYSTAKAAVVALMRSVADEGRDAGVRANALAPASIRTATNESTMGTEARYIEREDVANAVAYLCSDAARAITGQVIRLRG